MLLRSKLGRFIFSIIQLFLLHKHCSLMLLGLESITIIGLIKCQHDWTDTKTNP